MGQPQPRRQFDADTAVRDTRGHLAGHGEGPPNPAPTPEPAALVT